MRTTLLVLLALSLLAAGKTKPKPKATPAPTPVVEKTPEPTPTAVEEGWEETPSDAVSEEEAPIPADLPAQRGTVAAPDAAVYSSPSKASQVKIRLLPGTFVEAFTRSPDGEFVQVRVTEDGVTVQGWMRKAEVRSLSRYGFSWERKTK